ncbi:MAG: hypothetical protein DCC71_16825 [Proteobacteria bacterium]|nr:MAG: hypothetical protein DCC71_16825 [Pseudomonadota bacterium]
MTAVTRRSFLALAGSGAALASLASLRALPAAAAGANAATSAFFAPREREVLTQVVERMVDTGAPAAPPVRTTRTIDTIDALCAGLDPATTAPLPALLRLVEWGPVLFERRFARFTSLGAAGQDAALAGWMTSGLALRRMGFYALRNLALLGYWSQDETWPLIGYAGPLIRRPRIHA